MTKNYHPKLKFKLNISLDVDMAVCFYGSQKIGGVNFWKERAVDLYPELGNIDIERNNQKKKPKSFSKIGDRKRNFLGYGRNIQFDNAPRKRIY